MTLHVEVVVADRELWAGEASMVIAKTLEGDIGVLTGHPPVLGILAEGSLVRILDPQGGQNGADGAEAGGEVTAAVSGGFLSVADDQISILAVDAQLGSEVDRSAARSSLDTALSGAGSSPAEEPGEAKYARAQLRAAGEQA